MADRKEIERSHADRQAREVLLRGVAGASGSSGIAPVLRAPYLYAEKRLEEVIRAATTDPVVVDLGCGQGGHSIFPASLGARVIGIDISAAAIEVARIRAERDGVASSTEFCVADGERISLADGSVDVVLAVHALPCLDLRTAYSEISRVLRENGVAVVVENLGHNPILNLNRRINGWRGLRTDNQVRHILRADDLLSAQAYFADVDWAFFDLTTLALAPFAKGGFTNDLIARAQRLDARLLRSRPLQRLAFKTVGFLRRPLSAVER